MKEDSTCESRCSYVAYEQRGGWGGVGNMLTRQSVGGGDHLVVQQTSNQSSLPSCLTVHLTTIPPIRQLMDEERGAGHIDRECVR